MSVPNSPSSTKILSKSAFVAALQCPKLLWRLYHTAKDFPEPSQITQARFDEGREIGRLAQALFGHGIEVAPPSNAVNLVQETTREFLKFRRPLFEAGFLHEGTFARVDILQPVGSTSWDLFEVKGVTNLDDSHMVELGFEARVLAGAGARLRRCWLVHLNKHYVRRGSIDPHRFFVKVDCTEQISALAQEIDQRTEDAQGTIQQHVCPEVKIGFHCDSPCPCALREECWSYLPEHNVTELYRGKNKAFRLLQTGVQRISDIPDAESMTVNQEIQRRTIRTSETYVEPKAIRSFLQRLVFPLAFIDFETFSTGVPRFDGLKPYQRVPFQFSIHTLANFSASAEHRHFLAEGAVDPRREFMEKLRDAIPANGSVVAYNAIFEMGVLDECAEALPQFEHWVRSLAPRFIDLLQPFRKFSYYHAAQCGSASMKAVLPAIAGRGYEDLAIRDGETASAEFLRVTFGQAMAEERQRVRSSLLSYCGLDTLGMIRIVEGLRKAVGEN